MASPQPTDAHLRIAHSIHEAILIRNFTIRQRRIIDLIMRLSWGCGKKTCIIPKLVDFKIVGIYKSDIKRELQYLVEANVINWNRNTNTFAFNKNFDSWKISIVRGFNFKKLSELISLNLSLQNTNQVSELPTKLVESTNSSRVETGLNSEVEPPLKKVFKKNKDIYIHGLVRMSIEEYNKLCVKFGVDVANSRIEELDLYMQSKGKKYKSHYATILAWDKREEKENNKFKKSNTLMEL